MPQTRFGIQRTARCPEPLGSHLCLDPVSLCEDPAPASWTLSVFVVVGLLLFCLFSAPPMAKKKNLLCKLIWRSAVMKHRGFRPGRAVLLAVLITRVLEPGCHRLTGVRRLTGAFQPFVTQMAVPINRKTINHFSKD